MSAWYDIGMPRMMGKFSVIVCPMDLLECIMNDDNFDPLFGHLWLLKRIILVVNACQVSWATESFSQPTWTGNCWCAVRLGYCRMCDVLSAMQVWLLCSKCLSCIFCFLLELYLHHRSYQTARPFIHSLYSAWSTCQRGTVRLGIFLIRHFTRCCWMWWQKRTGLWCKLS